MRAVNLLPRDEPARSFEAKRGIAFLGAGGAALVTVALATLMMGASGAANQERQALDGINAELAAVPKPEPGATDPQDDATFVADKSARIAALSTVLAGRVAWDEVLRQISQVLPEDVWLSNLTTSSDAVAGSTLTLNGSTYSQDGVARFLSRISMLPTLENVQLQASAAGTDGVVQFAVVADVKTPAPGAAS